jgi:hypothetical protein
MRVGIHGRKESGFACSHSHISLCGGTILCYKFYFRALKEEKKYGRLTLAICNKKY